MLRSQRPPVKQDGMLVYISILGMYVHIHMGIRWVCRIACLHRESPGRLLGRLPSVIGRRHLLGRGGGELRWEILCIRGVRGGAVWLLLEVRPLFGDVRDVFWVRAYSSI